VFDSLDTNPINAQIMKKIYTLISGMLLFSQLQAQNPLLVEHFDYTSGDNLQNNGWYGHSAGTTNPIKVSNGGLSWSKTAYLGSGIGNAAAVSNTGSDENKPFSSWVDSGNVYTAFLFKVNKVVTTSTQGYFFHVGEYANNSVPVYTAISSAFRARTYVVPGSSTRKFRLGLAFNSSTAPSSAGVNMTSDLDTGVTYMAVVKYHFIPGSATNDSVSLFLFADGDDITAEPAKPTLGPLAGDQTDVSFIQFAALRQFNAGQGITVDGIIARTDWNWVATNNPVAPKLVGPANNASLRVNGPASTPVTINWTAAQNFPSAVYEWQADARAISGFNPAALALASDNSGKDTTLSLNFGALDQVLAGLGLKVGDTLKAVWRVRAVSSGDTLYSDTFAIDLIRGYMVAPLSRFNLLAPADKTSLTVAAGQPQQAVIRWNAAKAGTLPVTYQWLAIAKGGSFASPAVSLASDNSGSDTTLTVTLGALDNLLASLGLQQGDSIDLQWTVRAAADTQRLDASQIWDIRLKRSTKDLGSISNLSPPDNFSLRVNGPASTPVSISWTSAAKLSNVSYTWQADLRALDKYAPPALALASDNSGADTTLSLNFGVIDQVLASFGLKVGDTLKAVWRVRAVSSSSADTIYSESFAIDLIRGYMVAPLSSFGLVSPADGASLTVKPSQPDLVDIIWRKSTAGTLPVTYRWVAILPGGNFNTPTFSFPSNNSGKDTVFTVSYGGIDALLVSQGLKPGDSVTLQWAVVATADTQNLLAAQTRFIKLKRFQDPANSVNELPMRNFEVYPNPSTGAITLQFTEQLSGTMNISVVDANGRVVMQHNAAAANTMHLNLTGLSNGIYWIQVQSEHTHYMKRIALQQ
jgi:hypothetical protein